MINEFICKPVQLHKRLLNRRTSVINMESNSHSAFIRCGYMW